MVVLILGDALFMSNLITILNNVQPCTASKHSRRRRGMHARQVAPRRLGEGTAVCPGRHQAAVVDVGAYMILWEAESDKEWLRSPVLINPFFKKWEL